MQVSIKFCKQWNYDPIAVGLADAIKKEFGADVELIESSGGVFDVKVGKRLVYSKHETGRHIRDNEEVLATIRTLEA